MKFLKVFLRTNVKSVIGAPSTRINFCMAHIFMIMLAKKRKVWIMTSRPRSKQRIFSCALFLCSFAFAPASSSNEIAIKNEYVFDVGNYKASIKKTDEQPCDNDACFFDLKINNIQIVRVKIRENAFVSSHVKDKILEVFIKLANSKEYYLDYAFLVVKKNDIRIFGPFDFPEFQQRKNSILEGKYLFMRDAELDCVYFKSESEKRSD